MTFSDVLQDIRKLVGLELQSIRPGAAITILDVDEERGCLNLRTAQGLIRSRPLTELQAIWTELNRVSAVHVEGVLHGSGTSRNQPETIFANLPYIEWLKLDKKKHISLVNRNTHAYGTLKQMDAFAAAAIANLAGVERVDEDKKALIILVAVDVTNSLSILQAVLPGTVSTIEQGIYTYKSASVKILLVAANIISLEPGCYTVISSKESLSAKIVEICDEEYYVINEGGLRLLMRRR